MQYGHFDNENREYVIDRVDLPTSWTNYIGVKDMCAVLNPQQEGIFSTNHRSTTGSPGSVQTEFPWTGLDTMYI